MFLFIFFLFFLETNRLDTGPRPGVTACWFAIDVFEQTLCIITYVISYDAVITLNCYYSPLVKMYIADIKLVEWFSYISWIVFKFLFKFIYFFLSSLASPELSPPFREVLFFSLFSFGEFHSKSWTEKGRGDLM